MSAADDRYGDLLAKVEAVAGHDLAYELDNCIGERLSEAFDEGVAAVEAIHTPRQFVTQAPETPYRVCVEDRQEWPCATERALREVGGGTKQGRA